MLSETSYWDDKNHKSLDPITKIITSVGIKRCSILDYINELNNLSGDVVNDTILVCGNANWHLLTKCYSSKGGHWQHHTNLKSPRALSSGITLNHTTLWIVGGLGPGYKRVTSTELVHLNKKVEKGPELDYPLGGLCTMSHQNKIFITGRIEETNKVLVYDRSNIFLPPKNGPSMNYNRFWPACTIFNSPSHENRPVAVVASGIGMYKYYGSGITAELWDFTIKGSTWRNSKHNFY